jgi:hypothetical protein
MLCQPTARCAGSRSAFNCYWHSAQLLLRRRGQPCLIILSREGVTQGDPLSMIMSGIALLPLSKALHATEPMVLQPWYANDMAMAGPCSGIARATTLLERLGPLRGYYPEPSKSILISKPADQAANRQLLTGFAFKYVDGHRYVGGFIATDEAREAWLQPQASSSSPRLQPDSRIRTMQALQSPCRANGCIPRGSSPLQVQPLHRGGCSGCLFPPSPPPSAGSGDSHPPHSAGSASPQGRAGSPQPSHGPAMPHGLSGVHWGIDPLHPRRC